jgi:RNA polymerase sigma factor (sigma-70 family)
MEDAKIIQLYWDRDEQAIPATSAKYGAYCTAIARNILENEQDTEECVNDTWLRAWNAMPPKRPNRLAAFLGKITRNLSLDRYRYQTAEKRRGAAAALDELGDVVSDTDDPAQTIDQLELVRAINAFLATLPTEKRNLFVCRYWYFDDLSAIAARFGMTENQVSVTLGRLRRRLHKYLSERGFAL